MNEIQIEERTDVLELRQTGFRYIAPIYFGSSKSKADMAFDTGSSYTVVTSDICPTNNCSSQAYKPGLSETENNLGKRYKLDID